MVKVELEQGSDDWLNWRTSGLGASDAAAVLGLSPWTTPLQLWKQKRAALAGRGTPGEKRYSSAMARGHLLEPDARQLVEELLGVRADPVCCVHPSYDYLKASLDGLIDDRTIVEIKCPNSEAHAKALAGTVPDYYYPQLVHQSLVTGLADCWYVSYSPDREFAGADRLAVVPVTIDDGIRQIYLAAARDFWHCVRRNVKPGTAVETCRRT